MRILLFITVLVFPLILLAIYVLVDSFVKHQTRKRSLFVFIKHDGLVFLAAIYVILFVYLIQKKSFSIDTFLDLKVLTTIFTSAIVTWLALFIKPSVINHLEDEMKLTQDYDGLIHKYPREKDNWISEDKKMFPVIKDYDLYGKSIVIHDFPQKVYSLPEEIKEYVSELFVAHDTSHVYNQLNIRVDHWNLVNDSIFELYTSRTTYYNSLVTNRVLDYEMKNEMTVRDILQYGPFVPPLSESRLSNHIGFNGFLISNNKEICLVKRTKDMSIGKRTYGTSVSASMKVMYCLNTDKHPTLTVEGIICSIVKEIEDELKVKEKYLVQMLPEKNIIAAYRDIVEGNKPQFLVFAKARLTSKKISNNFYNKLKNKYKKSGRKIREIRELEDGDFLIWIPIKDLLNRKVIINPSGIKYNGKNYEMVPSATASLIMFREFYKEHMC